MCKLEIIIIIEYNLIVVELSRALARVQFKNSVTIFTVSMYNII